MLPDPNVTETVIEPPTAASESNSEVASSDTGAVEAAPAEAEAAAAAALTEPARVDVVIQFVGEDPRALVEEGYQAQCAIAGLVEYKEPPTGWDDEGAWCIYATTLDVGALRTALPSGQIIVPSQLVAPSDEAAGKSKSKRGRK